MNVENDYEPIIYEQPIYSHIYQNHDQFLLNYYTRPIPNNKTKEKIQKIVKEVTEENPTESSNTKNIYQNIPKETLLQNQKIWTVPLILESPKSKQLQTPELEIDFLIDSEAESNIINIPTWNEIKFLHFKTTSRLATAQGSTVTHYGKNPTVPCSHSNNGTQQNHERTI